MPEPQPNGQISLTELAQVVLSQSGREALEQAKACLSNEGVEEFRRRYPDLDDDFSDHGPSPLLMLLGIGARPYPVTIGWCEWSGEEEPGQVLEQVLEACRNLNFTPPSVVPGEVELGSVEALASADAALQEVGLRLLFTDPDSDTYHFTPVTAADFARLQGRQGEGFSLRAAPTL